jgi:hypothetical protein
LIVCSFWSARNFRWILMHGIFMFNKRPV